MRKIKWQMLFSALSLAVCVAMLAGATFAWFSDTVTNKGNRIRAGTLSVDLLMHDGVDGYVSVVGGEGDIFSDAEGENGFNWEPGVSRTVYLEVRNTGSLELKYNLDFLVLEAGLAEVLELSVAPGAQYGGADPVFQSLGTIRSLMDGGSMAAVRQGELAAAGETYTKPGADIGDRDFFAVQVKMLPSAGSTYQNRSFETDVVLTATQTNKGAGDNYDAEAALVRVRNTDELAAVPANATAVLMNDLALTRDVEIPRFVNIDYAGRTLDLGGKTLTLKSDGAGTADLGTDKSRGTVKNGVIKLNYPNGTVNAYGIYTDVAFDVTVSGHTFNFYGVIGSGSVTLNTGRMVVQNGAKADHVDVKEGATIEYKTSAKAENGNTVVTLLTSIGGESFTDPRDVVVTGDGKYAFVIYRTSPGRIVKYDLVNCSAVAVTAAACKNPSGGVLDEQNGLIYVNSASPPVAAGAGSQPQSMYAYRMSDLSLAGKYDYSVFVNADKTDVQSYNIAGAKLGGRKYVYIGHQGSSVAALDQTGTTGKYDDSVVRFDITDPANVHIDSNFGNNGVIYIDAYYRTDVSYRGKFFDLAIDEKTGDMVVLTHHDTNADKGLFKLTAGLQVAVEWKALSDVKYVAVHGDKAYVTRDFGGGVNGVIEAYKLSDLTRLSANIMPAADSYRGGGVYNGFMHAVTGTNQLYIVKVN